MCFLGFTSVAGFGVSSAAGFNVGLRVGTLSKFFIRNNLLLKLLRTLSFAPNDNPESFKKDFFAIIFVPLWKDFNSLAKLLYLLKRQYVVNNL